jgi:DNA-binding CsgD family transcriptional regulator
MELVGRTQERSTLDSLIELSHRGRGGALVIHGDAGIGKTALLDYAVRSAQSLGAQVIRLSGLESEMEMDFAALHRMLLPLLERRTGLPAPQRNALDRAFGLAAGSASDQFLISMAALTISTEAAADHPMLCVIDDAQWIDRASLEAVSFVARRLQADRLVILFSVRDLRGSGALADLPRLTVPGLAKDEAYELLCATAGERVEPEVAGRIILESRGSPLAIVELVEALGPVLTSGGVLPDLLPIGDRLEAHFLGQVRSLRDDTQVFLLLAAAETSRDGSTIRRASVLLGLDGDCERDAIDRRLVQGPHLEFRHPLIRSAVYGGASPQERRSAHAALAAGTDAVRDPDRRAWHLASAAVGADDDVATELEVSAQRARSRGGHGTEATFLARAAEMTSNPDERARRFLEAAQASLTAGNLRRAGALLGEASTGLDTPLLRARALRMRAALQSFTLPAEVPLVLLDAARALEELDVPLARDTYVESLQASMISCQFTNGITTGELAKAVLAGPCGSATDATVGDVLALGFAHRLAGSFADAVPMLRRGIDMLRSGEADAGITRWAVMGSNAAAELWDSDGYRRMLDGHEQSERARGALDALVITLNGLGNHEMWTGAFAAAEARYVEVSSILEALGRDASIWRLAEVENLAWQGRVDETRTNAAVLTGEVVFAGILSNLALLALTTLDVALGNYADALGNARQVYDADPVPHGNQVLPNLVEAGVRVGDRDVAGAALARLSERATASQTPWALGLLARCQALMASDTAADPLYEHAIVLLGDTDMAPDLARAHLLFGEWLRRQKRTIEAREHLRAAFDSFSMMGADAFAQRSRIELEATGERARRRTVETSFDLTPQENQIARLAAEGATNAEIAARLYLSRSTIDYHLRKVFQKLSITSRRQLARTLPRTP